MGMMRKAESGVERAFHGVFRRKAKVNVRPVELAWKLVKEMEDGRVSSRSRVYVPHEYAVYLCPEDWTRYESHRDSLARQLETHLLQHARKEGYSMVSPPTVTLTFNRDLKQGQFGIAATPVGSLGTGASPGAVTRPTTAVSPAGVSETAGLSGTDVEERYVLAVRLALKQGKRVREFTSSRVLIGRADEADFQLDDPNVSRRHAVLFWDRGRLYLRDLGSTNGTLLNGRAVNSAVVRPGDVIHLGASELTVEFG